MSHQVVVHVGDETRQVGGLTFEQAMQVDALVSAIASEVGGVWMELEQVWNVDLEVQTVTIESLVSEESTNE